MQWYYYVKKWFPRGSKVFKKVYRFYQRQMFMFAQGQSEIRRPFLLFNETVLLAAYFGGAEVIPPRILLPAYFGIMLVGILAGKFFKRMGFLDYNVQLGNEINPDIQHIKKELEEIKKILKDGKFS